MLANDGYLLKLPCVYDNKKGVRPDKLCPFAKELLHE